MNLKELRSAFLPLLCALLISCGGEDDDGPPSISGFTDVTDSPLVIGDLLQINGNRLNNLDRVTIDGIEVDVVRDDDDFSIVRIPAGLDIDQNIVVRVEEEVDDDDFFDEAVLTLEVSRLALVLAGKQASNSKLLLSVVDTKDNEPLYNLEIDGNANTEVFKLAFANFGALALIPTGNNSLRWLDLTRQQSNDSFATGTVNLGSNQTIGVVVATASNGDEAVETILVSDGNSNSNNVFSLLVDDDRPPYSGNPLSSNGSFSVSGNQLRSPVIDSNNNLFMINRSNDLLLGLSASISAGVASYPSSNAASLTANSQAIDLVATDSFVIAAQGNNGDISVYTNSNGSLASLFNNFTVDADALTAIALHPNLPVLYAATSDTNDPFYTVAVDEDLIELPESNEPVIVKTELPGGSGFIIDPTAIAIEPTEGQFLYLGLSGSAGVLRLALDSAGGVGSTPAEQIDFELSSGLQFDDVLGIAIQP